MRFKALLFSGYMFIWSSVNNRLNDTVSALDVKKGRMYPTPRPNPKNMKKQTYTNAKYLHFDNAPLNVVISTPAAIA